MYKLDKGQEQQFIEKGFVRIEGTFPKTQADECRNILWRDTGCNPDDPSTWTQSVVRLGEYTHDPFRKAVTPPCYMLLLTSL